jgi:hypothetical protein
VKWLKIVLLMAACGLLAAGDAFAGWRGPMVKGATATKSVVKPVPVAKMHHHRHVHRGHFRHHRGRVFIGAPLILGWHHYWGPDYYSSSPYRQVVSVRAEPLVYIERGDAAAPPGSEVGYWYQCADPDGYYPYVKDCAGGWRKVEPQPPSE